ncbi:MAG: hypothetical protein WKG03_00710 [Telluria sp.]
MTQQNDADFDAIKAALDAVAYRPDQEPDAYLTLLGRVLAETRDRHRAAQLAKFGAQFPVAGEAAPDTPEASQFERFQQVFTCEGYLGYIAGHDKQGRAIVNVVWEAAEYPEDKLTPIPGPAILDAMRA